MKRLDPERRPRQNKLSAGRPAARWPDDVVRCGRRHKTEIVGVLRGKLMLSLYPTVDSYVMRA